MGHIEFSGPDLLLTSAGPLAICVTDGPRAFERPNIVGAFTALQRLKATTHRDMLYYIYVAGEHSALPNAEARKMSVEITKLADLVLGIHEGDGIRASLVRAVVTGITMMASTKLKPHIVATPEQAAAWAAPRVGGALSEAQILEALRFTRAEINAAPTGSKASGTSASRG